MVIRTEITSQKYTMGSSDPFPAGFEIRFGSLNFQATRNSYLMHLTNRDELHPWRSTGPGPMPATPTMDAPAPTQAAASSTSTPRCRRSSGQRSRQARMERRRAARVTAQRDAPTDREAPTAEEHTVVGSLVPLRDVQHRHDVRLIRQHRRGRV
jgi:hypothetical protein